MGRWDGEFSAQKMSSADCDENRLKSGARLDRKIPENLCCCRVNDGSRALLELDYMG